MVQLYVDAINAPDAIPNVQSAWETFVEGKCANTKQSTLQMYDALMTARLSDALPRRNNDIRMCHNNNKNLGEIKKEHQRRERFRIEF